MWKLVETTLASCNIECYLPWFHRSALSPTRRASWLEHQCGSRLGPQVGGCSQDATLRATNFPNPHISVVITTYSVNGQYAERHGSACWSWRVRRIRDFISFGNESRKDCALVI